MKTNQQKKSILLEFLNKENDTVIKNEYYYPSGTDLIKKKDQVLSNKVTQKNFSQFDSPKATDKSKSYIKKEQIDLKGFKNKSEVKYTNTVQRVKTIDSKIYDNPLNSYNRIQSKDIDNAFNKCNENTYFSIYLAKDNFDDFTSPLKIQSKKKSFNFQENQKSDLNIKKKDSSTSVQLTLNGALLNQSHIQSPLPNNSVQLNNKSDYIDEKLNILIEKTKENRKEKPFSVQTRITDISKKLSILNTGNINEDNKERKKLVETSGDMLTLNPIKIDLIGNQRNQHNNNIINSFLNEMENTENMKIREEKDRKEKKEKIDIYSVINSQIEDDGSFSVGVNKININPLNQKTNDIFKSNRMSLNSNLKNYYEQLSKDSENNNQSQLQEQKLKFNLEAIKDKISGSSNSSICKPVQLGGFNQEFKSLREKKNVIEQKIKNQPIVEEVKKQEKNENPIMDKINQMKFQALNVPKNEQEKKLLTKNIFTPVRILDWLFLGNHKDSESMEVLRNNKIDTILNTTIECKNEFPKYFQYKKIPVCDTSKTNLKFYFNEIADFLENCRLNGKNVLVHCYMGISRSSSSIICYLIKYKGYTYESAYLHVKSKKPDIQPNSGFIKQLREFEEEVKVKK